jgi:hypothetical protein
MVFKEDPDTLASLDAFTSHDALAGRNSLHVRTHPELKVVIIPISGLKGPGIRPGFIPAPVCFNLHESCRAFGGLEAIWA